MPEPEEKPKCKKPYCDRYPYKDGYCYGCYQNWVAVRGWFDIRAFHAQSRNLNVSVGDA